MMMPSSAPAHIQDSKLIKLYDDCKELVASEVTLPLTSYEMLFSESALVEEAEVPDWTGETTVLRKMPCSGGSTATTAASSRSFGASCFHTWTTAPWKSLRCARR